MYETALPIVLSVPTIFVLTAIMKTIESLTLRLIKDPFFIFRGGNIIKTSLNYYLFYGITFVLIKYYLLKNKIKITIFLLSYAIIFRFVNSDFILASIFFISEFSYPTFPTIKGGLIPVILDKSNYYRASRRLIKNTIVVFICAPVLVFSGIKIHMRTIYLFVILHIYTEVLKSILFYNLKYVINKFIGVNDHYTRPSANKKENPASILQDVIFDNRYTYVDRFFDYQLNNQSLPIVREFLYCEKKSLEFLDGEIAYLNYVIDLITNIDDYYTRTLYIDYLGNTKDGNTYIVKETRSLRIFNILCRRIVRDIYRWRYLAEINRVIACIKTLGVKKDFSNEIAKLGKLEKEIGGDLGYGALISLSKRV